MRILDRYILSEYIKMFAIITLAFSVLFLVVDISDRMPRLIRSGASPDAMLLYFVLRLPYLFVLTSPVIVLLSGLFLMNTLSKYNESIAIRSAGVSIGRMVFPLFWVGFIFMIFIMIFGDLVLPKAEEHRQYLYSEQIRGVIVEDEMLRSHIHYLGEDNRLFYIGHFDGYKNLMKTVDITQYDPNTGRIERKITASDAVWEDDRWIFTNAYIRSFENHNLVESKFFEETELDEINVTPVDFIKSAKKPMAMNFFELHEYIQRLKRIGEKFHYELTELYFKISFPFANVIILFFCIPLLSTSNRSRGRGWVFAIGLVVCFVYLYALKLSQSMGHNEVISPLLAAWLPNIIFAILGIYFLIRAEV